MDAVPAIDGVDLATLSQVVQRVLNREDAELGHWEITPLSGSWTTAASGGWVYRAAGAAVGSNAELSWSAILKIADGPGEDPGPDGTWGRELQAYESGLLNDLPGGITAPRFYGGGLMPNGKVHLWLEDIVDAVPARHWTLPEYAVAARQLGAFNGAYLVDRELPAGRWLSRTGRGLDGPDVLRPTVAWFLDAASRGQLSYPIPSDLLVGVERVWSSLSPIIAALHRLPMTFCHLDAFSRNLFGRFDANNEQIVAIDWAMAGIAPIGQELVAFVRNTVVFELAGLAPTTEDLDRIAFPAYVDGLRDSGWNGDARLARLGFTAGAAFTMVQSLVTYGWSGTPASVALESAIGVTMEQFAEATLPWRRSGIRLFDEAQELVAALRLDGR